MSAARVRRRAAAGANPLAGRRGADAVLLDTGPLVALYARDDSHHAAAARWLARFEGELHTVEAVLAEAAYFLPARVRPGLAELVGSGSFHVHPLDEAAYGRIGTLMRKHADQDPDWADIALVWLAESTGIHRIATLDAADFGVYRIHGRRRFELELLR